MQQRKFLSCDSPHFSDALLISQTLEGDMDAFDALVLRYSERLMGFITNILRSSGQDDQSYDVLQHVLLQLYLTLPMLTTDTSLRPWLFRVAHNRCIDEIRKQRRRQIIHLSELEQELEREDCPLLVLFPDDAPSPEDIAEQHDLERHVRSAIEALPPKFRVVVSLRYTHQLNFAEIGRALNISPTTAKTYFHRARPLLRAALDREYASLPLQKIIAPEGVQGAIPFK